MCVQLCVVQKSADRQHAQMTLAEGLRHHTVGNVDTRWFIFLLMFLNRSLLPGAFFRPSFQCPELFGCLQVQLDTPGASSTPP
mmetsp:Transcript_118780/g.347915  ORF Transcript_118780/g.347915 Transcript_118780/m.347915 type:complete len:83 (+) Transcript_118780:191-439(+)